MTIEFLDALRPFFDCLTVGVCVADFEGRLLYANAATGRLLGSRAQEAVKTSICGALCGDIEGASYGKDALLCPMKTPRATGDAVTCQGKHAASGRDLEVRCLRVRHRGAELHFIVIEDDTAAAELRRQKEDWRQMLAHDVRAPLSIALGALRILENAGAGHPLSSEEIKLIQSGIRNCLRAEALIASYLETERTIGGAMIVHPAAVDVSGLIGELVAEHTAVAEMRGVTLASDAAANLVARADPELLRRAFTNLLENALKFTPRGGRIAMEASTHAAQVLVRVIDNGPGIPARDLPLIFERFYQGANAAQQRGFGLGLTFCRTALRAMGCEVAVESEEGKGSVFTVTLPQGAPGRSTPGKGD